MLQPGINPRIKIPSFLIFSINESRIFQKHIENLDNTIVGKLPRTHLTSRLLRCRYLDRMINLTKTDCT